MQMMHWTKMNTDDKNSACINCKAFLIFLTIFSLYFSFLLVFKKKMYHLKIVYHEDLIK